MVQKMFEIFFGLKGFDTAVTITSVVRSANRSAILSMSSICTLVRRHDIPRTLSKRDKSRLFASHKKFCVSKIVIVIGIVLMTTMRAREVKLCFFVIRYLLIDKVYLVVPISRKMEKVFWLELFVCYSWIVFLVNAHISGIHDATRFLENTLEFMRDVSFRYLRIILSILIINFMISSPE